MYFRYAGNGEVLLKFLSRWQANIIDVGTGWISSID